MMARAAEAVAEAGDVTVTATGAATEVAVRAEAAACIAGRSAASAARRLT